MEDVLADLPGYALRRASTAMQSEFSALLAPLGLRPTDASLLVLVEANSGITPSALGQGLGIQRANMVPLVARMESSGYVSRLDVDGRSFGLTLTETGVTTCLKVKQIIAMHQERILDRIHAPHRAHLVASLKALWQ